MDKRLGEWEREASDLGRDGLGMVIGELMFRIFFGGEVDGLMLSDDPNRDRKLPSLLFLSPSLDFSFGTAIQGTFSGMLRVLVS